MGPKFLCVFLHPLLFIFIINLPVFDGHLHSIQNDCDELVLLLWCLFFFLTLIQFFWPAHLEAILSHTFPRLCHPLYASILCGFRDLLSSFLFLGSATMPYLSIQRLSSGTQSPHSFHRRIPIPWHATCFPHFSYKEGSFIFSHIFLALILVLIWYSIHVSSFCLLKLNKFVIVFCLPPLIFPVSAVSKTKFHFQRRKRRTHDSPVAGGIQFSSQTHFMARHIPHSFHIEKQAHLHTHHPGHITRSRMVFHPRLVLLSFQTE